MGSAHILYFQRVRINKVWYRSVPIVHPWDATRAMADLAIEYRYTREVALIAVIAAFLTGVVVGVVLW